MVKVVAYTRFERTEFYALRAGDEDVFETAWAKLSPSGPRLIIPDKAKVPSGARDLIKYTKRGRKQGKPISGVDYAIIFAGKNQSSKQ